MATGVAVKNRHDKPVAKPHIAVVRSATGSPFNEKSGPYETILSFSFFLAIANYPALFQNPYQLK